MNVFGMCLNWKVIGGVVAVLAATIVVAPGLLPRLAPLLLLALCPLMMLLMMRHAMGSDGHAHHSQADVLDYTCPKHSYVRTSVATACPVCGTPLVRISAERGDHSGASAPTGKDRV